MHIVLHLSIDGLFSVNSKWRLWPFLTETLMGKIFSLYAAVTAAATAVVRMCIHSYATFKTLRFQLFGNFTECLCVGNNLLRPNTSYQFRYRERKKPIRNNYGTKLQQMFNYPCYLPTLQQTGGAVDAVYMHRFRTAFEFPCVVPSVLTLSGPATPLQPSCKGCLVAWNVSVQFVFVYSNMLHKKCGLCW